MNAIEATLAVSQLLGLALNLLVRAQEVSGMIAAAQQEGRDLTQEEIDKIVAAREAARAAALAATHPSGLPLDHFGAKIDCPYSDESPLG